MLRKVNTKTLFIVFAVLIGLVVLTVFKDSSDNDRTFKDELYQVDSSQVKTIFLYPSSDNHNEIKLVNTSGKEWEVQSKTTKADVDTSALKELIHAIIHLKPTRLAASEKSRWKDFNVDDSLGTRIKALDASQKTLIDVVIGKFSYNQQSRSGITYLRLYDDEKVYAADGFLPLTCNQKIDHWRNKNVIASNKADWTSLAFSYPGDTGFVMKKEKNKWMLNGENCDLAKTEQYMNTISHLSGNKFIDNYDTNEKKELYGLKIEGNNQFKPVTVKVYAATDTTDKYIINSSINPRSYFSGLNGNLFQTLLPGKNSFMPVDSSKVVEKKGK